MGLRKKHHEEHENLERWLVSYADFITLLFAFFTVLYAISQKDKKTYQKTVENIQRAFLSAGGIFPLKGSPFTPFEKPQDTGSVVPPSPTEPGNQSKNETGAPSYAWIIYANIPYLLWVSFATALQLTITYLNR
jgi:flagellar motor protein MotB